MTVVACLLLYSLVVIVIGPPVLRRLTRGGEAPQLGVAAWLTAIATVLISWVAAVVALIAQLVSHWDHRQSLIASCVVQLRLAATGQAGVLLQVALAGLVIAAAVAVGISGVRLAGTLVDMLRRSHRHAEAVHLVGRRTAVPDVLVLDAESLVAYCVSGRPPAIVLTSAAMDALDDRQVCAVVAHERAHLTGRHPHIVAALRGLAGVLPRLALTSDGLAHVSRLVEMCADDVAARKYGREALLTGMLAMSGSAPAGALSAADVAVFERARRLAESPSRSAHRRCGAALMSTMTLMVSGPLIIASMTASGLLLCGMR